MLRSPSLSLSSPTVWAAAKLRPAPVDDILRAYTGECSQFDGHGSRWFPTAVSVPLKRLMVHSHELGHLGERPVPNAQRGDCCLDVCLFFGCQSPGRLNWFLLALAFPEDRLT